MTEGYTLLYQCKGNVSGAERGSQKSECSIMTDTCSKTTRLDNGRVFFRIKDPGTGIHVH